MDYELAVALLGIGSYLAAALIAMINLRSDRDRGEGLPIALLALGAILLGGLLTERGIRIGLFPAFTRFDAVTAYTLGLTLAYFGLMALRPTRGIPGVLAIFATLILLSGLPDGTTATPTTVVPRASLIVHILLAFGSYALLSLASVLAIIYLIQDANLKNKRLGPVWERLPALETLDHLMRQLVGLGFLLLTGSIVLGITLIQRTGGDENWLLDPKIGATATTWILFAALVHLRARADRHGRSMAVVTLAGLACLLFTFIGVHLIAHSIHGFVGIVPPR